jgi:hypothetical protein
MLVVLSRRACDKSERMKPRYTAALALVDTGDRQQQ